MLLSFKALATFSLGSQKPSSITFTANEGKVPPLTPPKNDLAILPFDGAEPSISHRWSCQCGSQQTDFCPYCEYDRTNPMLDFTALKSPPISGDIGRSGSSRTRVSSPESPSQPRKLRKVRSDYKQLKYEALSLEAVLSNRPDSILWKHSTAPVLDVELPSNLTNSPSPPIQRAPRKLGKKNKRRRASSAPNSPACSSFDGSSSAGPRVRIVKSKSFLNPRNHHAYGPRPRPVSGSFDTNALISLAWTGELLSSFRSSEVILPGPDNSLSLYSTFSPIFLSKEPLVGDNESQPETQTGSNFLPLNTSPKQPSALRKLREVDSRKISSRPWTLAMAIIDDSITNEKLVDDLENMRIREKLPDSVIPDPFPLPLGFPLGYHDPLAEYPLASGELVQEDPGSSLDSSWNAARHALLLCRELVHTERRYLASLKTLITNGTSTPPPPSMLSYLPGLIAASETLLSMMEENPSVQGVSQAFIACEDKLAESFINWCGVVGQFFDFEERTKNNLEKTPESSSPKLRQSRSGISSRTISTDTVLPVVIPEPNRIRRNTKARPAVRDLAILPTQRITRYVLLLKELRSLTPSTLFVLVENAVQAAESVAAAANEAQGLSTLKSPPPG